VAGMDDDFAARAQVLEDRVAINDLIIRYAEAVDNHDDAALASCFTDDAEATFAGVAVPGRGGAAIVAFLGSLPGGSAGTGAPMKTSHLFTNVVINIDGDEAEARSRAAVYSVRGNPEQVRVRSISYQDRMRRTPDGWRIANRVHSAAWEGAMESVPITPLAPQSEQR
jgi:3-phenylpropionate/cinnamic acid dioxygenase small subunit